MDGTNASDIMLLPEAGVRSAPAKAISRNFVRMTTLFALNHGCVTAVLSLCSSLARLIPTPLNGCTAAPLQPAWL